MKRPALRSALRPRPVLAGILLLAGCHVDTTEDPAFRPQMMTAPAQAGAVAEMPTARPTPVATPGPPPRPKQEQAPVCDDAQIAVPGQWIFTDGWSWQPGYCVLDRAGYAYIPPTYERGLYVAGYFAVQHEVNRVGPTYRRFVHPDGMELAPPRQEAPAPPPAEAPQAPTLSIWGATPYRNVYGILPGAGTTPGPRPAVRRPAAPRVGDKYDPGQGERPRRPPPGWGERP